MVGIEKKESIQNCLVSQIYFRSHEMIYVFRALDILITYLKNPMYPVIHALVEFSLIYWKFLSIKSMQPQLHTLEIVFLEFDLLFWFLLNRNISEKAKINS